MVTKRKRSPNYPAMSLPEAIKLVEKIYKDSQRYPANSEAFAKILGYKSLSGRALRVIATLSAFGLLEGRGDELRVSDLGESICIDPKDTPGYANAVRQAAHMPPIYDEVFTRYDKKLPGDQVLRAFLLRNEYSQNAVNRLCNDLRETYDFVQDLEFTEVEEDNTSDTDEYGTIGRNPESTRQSLPEKGLAPSEGRELFSYTFEPSGSMRVIITDDVDPRKAIVMLEKLIALKKEELGPPPPPQAPPPPKGDSDEPF